jgi:hypothetical protein
MFIYKCLSLILFTFSTVTCIKGFGSDNVQSACSVLSVKDTLKENLNLYNGRLWINAYYKIKGDPFFLSGEFLSGSVTFNGIKYPAQKLKYEIYNDEIILRVNPVTIIILNKEMVDSVSLNYQNKTYKVIKLGDDSTNVVKGLVNVLYEGPTTLLVKFKKVIDLLAVDKRYDLFYQIHKIYVEKDNKIFLVSGKKDLLKILEDKAPEIKNYIKANKLVVIRKDPESLIPVLRYYDSLKKQE